jgi:shikimate dehydrogenase
LAATKGVYGLSLIMPHKIAGYAYCATVSETSRMLGVDSAFPLRIP